MGLTIVLNNISYTKQHHRHYISKMKVLFVSVFLFVSVAMARPDAPPPAEYGPAAYSYTWAVKDDYTSNNYGQNEDRNGATITGSYYVALPDGRLQKVTYSVDAYGGYVADVSYEGEAQYPEAKPYVPAPAPAAAY